MSTARIIHFPRAARRRSVPQPRVPVRSAARRSSRSSTAGFGLLLFVTMAVAFLYLSGALHVTRHDSLYAALLALVWGVYFTSGKWLRTPLGRLLRLAGQLLVLGGLASFFGFVLWLVLSHP